MQVNKLPPLENSSTDQDSLSLQSTKYTLFTVSQLTLSIKHELESRFRFVYVQGEITNLKFQSSGHIYFSLKDPAAQISAVMFKGDSETLSRPPQAGDHVIVLGEMSVYPPRGNYQLIVRKIRYIGLGELLLKLEELKKTLQQRGWFDEAYKKPLPKFPKTIGVVTSPTGAVIKDILNILERRFLGVHVILNPVKVQGEGAAEEIALAIEQFNQYKLADVLIVGRGGGSLEDLWAFNEEIVAKAIFNSQIPIISAVGHETDNSIADLVADVRAPTPSAAAEIVIAEKQHWLQFLAQTKQRLSRILALLVQKDRHKLQGILRHPLFTSPYTLLSKPLQQIDDLRMDIDSAWQQKLTSYRNRLNSCQKQLNALKPSAQLNYYRQNYQLIIRQIDEAMIQKLQKQRREIGRINHILHLQVLQSIHRNQRKIEHLQAILSSLDPRNIQKKGYSIAFSENKERVIFSTKQLKAKDQLILQFADGEALVSVNKVIPN